MCFLYLTTLNLKFYCSEDPGTKDAIFLFAKVPDILENRENVMKLLDLLNFPLQLDGVNIKMVADIKLLNVLKDAFKKKKLHMEGKIPFWGGRG